METKRTGCLELESLRQVLFGGIDSEWKRLKVCLFSTILIGLIAHGYGFLNFTINHDSLQEFYWAASRDWKITLGRFMEPVLRYLMGEIIVMPWLTGLTGLLFAGLAVHLMSKMFSLDMVWENVLLSGICITNVTVTAMIASYLHDFCGDMLALLMAVCAAYAWYKMKDGFSWKFTLLGAMCLWISFGFYQAYLSVMITLLCMDALIELLRGVRAGNVVKRLLQAAPMGIIAFGAYFICASVLRRVFDVTVGEAYDMMNIGKNMLHITDSIKAAYRYALSDVFLPNYGYTLVAGAIQGVFQPTAVVVCLSNLVLLGVFLNIVLKAFKQGAMGILEKVLIVVLIVLLPACMMCVNIASTWLHHLTRYAVCLYPLIILLTLKYSREYLAAKPDRRQRYLVLGLIGIILFSNIQISNVAYVKKDLERQSTMSIMTRVLSNLERYDGYVYGESTVAIIGDINRSDITLDVGAVDQITGLTHNTQASDKKVLKYYLEAVLQYDLDLCTNEQESEIVKTEEFQKMGCFPAKDCVATINGVVVIKMDEDSRFA